MRYFSTDLPFDLDTLRFDAAATLRALCDRFEPEHARGLDMLLGAAEFVQRTVIGPPGADAGPYLAGSASRLPEGCVEVDAFSDLTELAGLLTDHGWPTAVSVLWEEDGSLPTFADSYRTVACLQFEATIHVTIAGPDRPRSTSALVERGCYLATACGERLFFTDALTRLPLSRNPYDFDFTVFPEISIDSLRADCRACGSRWRVDPAGDFRRTGADVKGPVRNFFEEATGVAPISAAIDCPDIACDGRVVLT